MKSGFSPSSSPIGCDASMWRFSSSELTNSWSHTSHFNACLLTEVLKRPDLAAWAPHL